MIMRKGIIQIDDIGRFWHGPYPSLFFGIVPRIPVHFIVAHCGTGCHGEAHPVKLNIRFVLQALKGTGNKLGGQGVLCLKILVEYTDYAVGTMLTAVIQQHIQQQRAVFSAAKGDKNIIKFLE